MFQVEKSPQELSFGRQGESNILSYAFDYSEWAEDWPGGMASMTVILPNQTQAWPIPDTQAVVEGAVITLHVLDNLTAKEGRGTLIIRYEAGPNKKRSRVIEFIVEKGHAPAGPAPDPVEDWIDEATKTLNDVKSLEFTVNEDGELLAGETVLGRVSDNPRGDYTPDADPLYSKRDIVFDNGGSYRYINDTPSNEPTSSTSHWQQIASQGLKGDAGGTWTKGEDIPLQSGGTVGEKLTEIANDFNEAVGAVTADSEVVLARGGKTVLGDRLDETDTQLMKKSIEIKKNNASTRNISNLQTLVTFIDDDGYNGVLDILKPMFTSRGVPCVIATHGAASILQTEEKREQLRDLQNNHGWEIASHTMTHIHLSSSTDEEIEDDCVNFLNLMHDYGLDVESMVYPWGEMGNTSIISKYYRAGFGTANGVNNDIYLDDYNIGRESLGNSPSRDLQFYKDMIDSIDGEPKWLVFMTHISDPATNAQQIEDVVDYVISKNIPIVTAKEGLKHYGSLINSRTNIPSNLAGYRYTKIKSSGLIDTNRYFLNYRGHGNNGIEITGDTPASDFDVGVTTKHFTYANRGSLPSGGVLITNKAAGVAGYTTQFYFSTISNSTYIPLIRYRIATAVDDTWNEWTSMTGVVSGFSEDSLPATFPYGESIAQANGWSFGNGTVKTIRASASTGFSKQIFYKALGTQVYIRAESSSGTWGDWKQFSVV